jgi:cell division protein FtsB
MAVPDSAHSSSAPGVSPEKRPRVRQRLRTPQEARQWRRRIAGYVLTGLSFVLVVNALVGENGYLASLRISREERALAEEVRAVREQNQRMRDQIQRLKTDPNELEDAARKYLHMTRPGEKLIIVKPAPPATPPVPATPAPTGK